MKCLYSSLTRVTLTSLLLLVRTLVEANVEINEELKCGAADSDRIIGGTRARLGQYPWLARLGYNSTGKKGKPIKKIVTFCDYFTGTENITFECGGALISKRHVLTASHCVQDIEPAIV